MALRLNRTAGAVGTCSAAARDRHQPTARLLLRGAADNVHDLTLRFAGELPNPIARALAPGE